MKEPIPLLTDPTSPAELRADLTAFRDAPVSFDLDSALARFEARLESGDLSTDADDAPSDFESPSELDGPQTPPKTPDASATPTTGTLGAGAGKLLAILALGAGAGFAALQLAGSDPATDASLPPELKPRELPVERTEAPNVATPLPERNSTSLPEEHTAGERNPPTSSPQSSVPAPRPRVAPPAEPAPEEVPLPAESTVEQPASPPPAAANEAPRNALQRELAQLGEIRKALATDPRRALTLADRGHVEFHGGSLYQEREALALRALHALGEEEALESRGRAFLLRYPKSSFAREVERLLAE